MINLAIFASGSGTNAQKIMEFFVNDPQIQVRLVCSNNPEAFVLTRAENFGIPTLTFNKLQFKDESFVEKLKKLKIDFIVLAGFLWKIPQHLIDAYPDRILNIHPSLLPKFGGIGMYGEHVHQAVISAQETISGITIHLVNEKYDDGRVIFQDTCLVMPDDSAESLAEKIQVLEHEHYPKVIREFVLGAI